jgi:retinol dehydrogenase-12
MASRSSSKASTAIDRLHSLVPGSTCHYIPLDLSDLSSIKAAADEFKKREEKLDVLFCNAGVMVPDMKEVTKQGYDLQFGTNVLGHHYLIGLLVSPPRPVVPSRTPYTSSPVYPLEY